MYQDKKGYLVKEEGDCEWETPSFVKDFWSYVMKDTLFDRTLPKVNKVNILK